MLIDVNRIIDAVELDRFPERRRNHLRAAAHPDRQTADLVEAIESPRSLARRVLRRVPSTGGNHVRDGPGDCDCCKCESVPCSPHEIPASGWRLPTTVLPAAARHGD